METVSTGSVCELGIDEMRETLERWWLRKIAPGDALHTRLRTEEIESFRSRIAAHCGKPGSGATYSSMIRSAPAGNIRDLYADFLRMKLIGELT